VQSAKKFVSFQKEEAVSESAGLSRLFRSAARLVSVSLAAVACVCVATVPAHAQILYGSITGVVKDAQGALIPGATVTAVNKDTNLTRETVTTEDGSYTLTNVLPGPYDVKIALAGFREAVHTDVPVTIAQISRVDITLEVGALSESITVASEAQLLQTDKADVHTELKSGEITSMPLNRFRNYQALMSLVPGTTPMAFGNAETDTPARSLATNVNGQVNTNNTTRTDGATNMNIWLPNHNMYISPAETVDTVNVSTSSFDAEQGNAGGAAVTVVTKSGTNIFHGSAFEFYNSDKLNATPKYFGAGDVPKKLPVTANTYGGTFGGPIKKDKVFFFGSLEGFRRDQSLFTLFNVPDARLRAGDFSQALNANGTLQTIYDPTTGTSNGVGRAAFPNNQIPANMISPVAIRALNLFPLPNNPGTGVGGFTNNYRRQEDRSFARDNWDTKVNWNRTSSQQIWGKFSYMNATVDDLTNYLGPDPNASGDGGFTKVYQATAGTTWTLRPTLLMDVTFGFGRQDQHVLGPDFQAGNFGLDVLGIPGTNDQNSNAFDFRQRYAGYPQFDFTTFSSLGNRDGWNPIFRDERTYSLAANVTKMKGRHDLRAGYLMNFFYLDHWQPETGNPRGQFAFNGAVTALNGGPQTNNFYNVFATFLLGYTQPSKSVQNELMTAREWQHTMYFRDRWTPTTKLTFDLGVRYELYPIMHRADGRGVDRLDLTNLDVLIAGRGNNPQNNGMNMSWDNIAPRLGAIYRFNEKTVFRTGYGITYNATPWARAVRGDNDYPITLAISYPNVDPFGYFGTLQQGVPTIVAPDQSTGRATRPRSGGVHARSRQHRSRLRADLEPGVRAPHSVGHVGGRRLRRREGHRRLRGPRHQRADGARHRQPGTSVLQPGTHQSGQLVGRSLEDDVPVAADVAEQAVHARADAERRLHAEQVAERERQRWPCDAELEYAERAVSQLRARRLRPHAQLPDGVRLRAAVADEGQLRRHPQHHRQRLAGQRPPGGVQRYAFHRDGQWHQPEHAEQHTDRRSGRVLQHDRGDWRRRPVVRHHAVRAADGRPLRQHRPE